MSEQREHYHAGSQGQNPAPSETIDRITFADGSEIVIRVTGPSPTGDDLAGLAYREFLYYPLLNLEQFARGQTE